jgi:hypothetical protein
VRVLNTVVAKLQGMQAMTLCTAAHAPRGPAGTYASLPLGSVSVLVGETGQRQTLIVGAEAQ